MSTSKEDFIDLRPDGVYAIKGAAIMAILDALGDLPRRHNALAEHIETVLGSARELSEEPAEKPEG